MIQEAVIDGSVSTRLVFFLVVIIWGMEPLYTDPGDIITLVVRCIRWGTATGVCDLPGASGCPLHETQSCNPSEAAS